MRFMTIVCLLLLFTTILQAQDAAVGIDPAIIGAYPAPDVQQLYPDESLLYDRAYRRVNNSLQMFDAPSGNLTEDMGKGFNFVTLAGVSQPDWEQVTPDRWMRTSDLSEEVNISRFGGVFLPENPLPYPMAWTLRHLRASRTPGADEDPNNEFMYRYTLVNLYTSVTVDGKLWYQIGVNKWVHQFDVARPLAVERPAGINTEKWVSVDLYEQSLIAYEGTRPVFATLISSGLSDWPTNEGMFNVYFRRERTVMSGAEGLPDFYYLEEVPWTMFFDDDIALHGTYWHDGFGYRRSHGCVNMSITDSNWLYRWSSDVRDFTNADSVDMAVYVYSSGKYD